MAEPALMTSCLLQMHSTGVLYQSLGSMRLSLLAWQSVLAALSMDDGLPCFCWWQVRQASSSQLAA